MKLKSEKCGDVFTSFLRIAERFPDNECLHIPGSRVGETNSDVVSMTYSKVLGKVRRMVSCYENADCGTGHRVALALGNRPEFFIHFLALNSIGVSVVPMNMDSSERELAYVLDHSDVALAVTLGKDLATLEKATLIAASQTVVVTEDMLANGMSSPFNEGICGCPADTDEAALLYTSGTTGQPKGCILSNSHLLAMGRWYTTAGGLCELEEGVERLITPLPLYHANALVCSFMAMIHSGGCLIQLDRFHPSSWWDSVRQSGATIIHYLGVMPAILLGAQEHEEENFSAQIKFGFGAGADPLHQQVFEERFGFPLIEAWAMTETGAGAIFCANHEPRHLGQRCFGRPAPEVEFCIVDEAGDNVARGEAGELLVRREGPDPRRYFFSGYYKNAEATEEAWSGDWFHTGDVVREGQDGSLFFVDRRKNIIRRSGENIAAVEVEGVLLKQPAVKNCAVAPTPDTIRGEEVTACIQLNSGFTASQTLASEIVEACRQDLSYFKLPGHIVFMDILPMTGSQKLQRSELKKLALQAVDTGVAFDMTSSKKRRKSVNHLALKDS